MYYVYVLKSLCNGKKYIGLTGSLPEERLKQHNYGSNKWSKANRPFELIYTESYSNKVTARKRELFLKTDSGRRVLDRLIERIGGYSSIGQSARLWL